MSEGTALKYPGLNCFFCERHRTKELHRHRPPFLLPPRGPPGLCWPPALGEKPEPLLQPAPGQRGRSHGHSTPLVSWGAGEQDLGGSCPGGHGELAGEPGWRVRVPTLAGSCGLAAGGRPTAAAAVSTLSVLARRVWVG